MRRAAVSTQKVLVAYLEDITLRANAQLGDSGACRRR